MSRSELQLSWRMVLLWYLIALALSTCGTFLAYNGPLSSEAWQSWSGTGAWKRDVLRAVVAAIIAIFVLWHTRQVLTKQKVLKHFLIFAPHRRHEWILLLVLTTLLLWLILVLLPEQFRANLPKEFLSLSKDEEFRQIRKPYFPYYIYVVGFWYGIVWPAFICLVRSIQRDFKWRQQAWARLNGSLPDQSLAEGCATSGAFERLLVAFQAYVLGLKEIAERYLPVLLALALGLLYEQLTPSHQTVTRSALEYGKVVLWLVLGPALFVLVTFVALGYQSAAQKLEAGFGTFAETLVNDGNKFDLLDRVLAARADLFWHQSPATFVFSVVKGATVSITLLVSVTGYVLHTLTHGEWIHVFVPKMVVDFIKSLFE
jgi:hypothetical protein